PLDARRQRRLDPPRLHERLDLRPDRRRPGGARPALRRRRRRARDVATRPQDRPRPARDRGRPPPPPHQPRRAAAALERGAWRHEPGRPAPRHPVRSRALHGVAQAASGDAARDHRPVAGERPECPVFRGDGPPGHPVHGDLVARARHEDPAQDRAGPPVRPGILMAAPVRIGVVGCGYWGPNHIRVFSTLGRLGARMVAAADRSEERLKHVSDLYPGLRLEPEAETVLRDPGVDAVVVATPVHTHYPFARMALQAGKHVLVENPFVTEVERARELIDLARRRGLVLMAGHTFEYAAAVNRMREMLAESALGEVLYVRSERVNLGLFQKDINVLWDLAPHD